MEKCFPKLLTLAMSLVVASACTVGPRHIEPAPADLAVPAEWHEPVPTASAPDLPEWWQQFRDPLLTSIIERAITGNLDLATARERLTEARARRNLSGAGRLPTVDWAASLSRSDSSDTGSTRGTVGVDGSWEVPLFGRTQRAYEAAVADFESTEMQLNDTHVSLVAEVARNYVELRSLQRRALVASSQSALQIDTLELDEASAGAGLISHLEVEQARTILAQTRASIVALRRSITETAHRLALLIGAPPGALEAELDPPADLPEAPDGVAVGVPAELLRRRPDLRAAERRLAAETARLGQAMSERYPSLRLSGSIGLEALSIGDGASFAASLAANLLAPLFDGGRIRERINIQDSIREQTLLDYRQAVLIALGEVEDALVALQRSNEREAELARAAAAAREAVEMARIQFQVGLRDFHVVLETQRTVLTVEDALVSAQADGVTAVIRLYETVGGGWTVPENEGFSR